MRPTRDDRRRKRHARVRRRVSGTAAVPRLAIYRSLRHVYASLVVDDCKPNRVLLGVSSLSAEIRAAGQSAGGGNRQGAASVGALLAAKCRESGIERVVFDRGGFRYTGRVKELAEAARKGGLKF